MRYFARRVAGFAAGVVLFQFNAVAISAEALTTLETVEVIGTTPTHGVGLPIDKIPANTQTATDQDLDRTQALDLSSFMNRNLGSVTINAAQNNPLQPDLQYRGFTASPLLGLPQGIAVYQNSVRINEVFGDTVNWDLIPESAIASINLIAGSNPLFGQNTLGGALSVITKNGFTHPGHTLEVYGGSFGRSVSTVETGANNGSLGYYATASYFNEAGWRDVSDSDALNFYGTVGWHTQTTTLDLHVSHGDTELRGNGPAPVELLARERNAFFTAPDITRNFMQMVDLEGTHWVTEEVQLSGNLYYRWNDIESFNGDGTPFEECEDPANAGNLCFEQEDAAGNEVVVRDQFGNPVTDEFDAINNLSTRDQRGYGGSLQTTVLTPLFGRENQFIAGLSYSQGLAVFNGQVEAAQLLRNRTTSRTGLFIPDDATSVAGRTRTWSAYLTDTFSVTDALNITLSGRFNSTRVLIGDRSGDDPALNGEHDFERFNPAGGLTYKFSDALSLYGGYSESSRAPTIVELSCARPDAPCNLPNAFLADPPLLQVVAKGFEGGLRGKLKSIAGFDLGKLNWNLGYFEITNKDDIIFQSTGGITSNRGFFANIGDTRRRGMELGLRGSAGKLDWYANYSFVQATFEDEFIASSPSHPGADENGNIAVAKGNRIPGIPEHNLKLGLDYEVLAGLRIGGDLIFNSDQFLRGDEANRLDTVDGYAVVNLHGEYRVNRHVAFFGRIENLFDSEYETFGLLGEPDEVFSNFEDPRFLGPGAPIGGWVGVRLTL